MVVSVSQSVSQLGSYRGPTAITRCQKHEQACPCCAYNTRRTPLQHTVIWCLRLVSEKVSEAATFFLVFQLLSSVYSLEGPDEADQKESGLPGLLNRLSTGLDWTCLPSTHGCRVSRVNVHTILFAVEDA